MQKSKLYLWILTTGVADGYAQPFDLTSGITFNVKHLNEIYDWGVNFGQFMGSLKRRR